jgi:hypothetical protein
MRNYSGSRAAIFTSPLSPAFGPFLYQALLFSISSLCLYYFRLYEARRFRARTRRSAKGPTAETATAEHCLAIHIAGRRHSPITAQRAMAFGVSKIQLSRPFLVAVTGPVLRIPFRAPSHHYNRSKPRKLLAIQQEGGSSASPRSQRDEIYDNHTHNFVKG